MSLSREELTQLVSSVFPPRRGDRNLVVLIDIPRRKSDDNPDWRIRRSTARGWAEALRQELPELGWERVELVGYGDVGSNNAELPNRVYILSGEIPECVEDIESFGRRISLSELFEHTHVFLAPTEYSTTAPLKIAGRKFGFRAATMPGFSDKMLPALRLDYSEVGRRVDLLKERLDRARAAEVDFSADSRRFHASFDLRFRLAHASSGRFPEPGGVGNLPSGEAYIVPYEGERDEPSETSGIVPVQFGPDLVLYHIERNRAVKVEGEGESREREARKIQEEPAYANIAELGFGVLGDFGIRPVGETLLDEKLGFHIAFGRSDHFGGAVGPEKFSSAQAVVHIDRIYIPETQPRVRIEGVTFLYPEGQEKILENNAYTIF